MNTKYMADILEDILNTSRTSAETLYRRTIYNGDVLGSKIETLILGKSGISIQYTKPSIRIS